MGVGEPAVDASAKRRVHRTRERGGGVCRYERAGAGSAVHEALALELAVRLQHGIWVDRQFLDDLPGGRKAVARSEHFVAHGVLDLLDELQVGRYARPRVEVESDGVLLEFLYDIRGIAQSSAHRNRDDRAS